MTQTPSAAHYEGTRTVRRRPVPATQLRGEPTGTVGTATAGKRRERRGTPEKDTRRSAEKEERSGEGRRRTELRPRHAGSLEGLENRVTHSQSRDEANGTTRTVLAGLTQPPATSRGSTCTARTMVSSGTVGP